MKRALALLSACLLSGCITQRTAVFDTPPGPLPFTTELQGQPLERTWAIGEIFVTADPGGFGQQRTDDWTQARNQIEARLAETLRRQTALGRRVEDRKSAELVVDLDVRITEARALNAWMVPALLSETALLVAGAGAGAAVGAAAIPDRKEEGAIIGSALGFAVAVAPAVVLPLLFPTADVVGTADARLAFRRASDGVVIYEKKTRATWIDRHSGIGVEEKLARITGAGAELLEKEIVAALYAGLRASPPVEGIAVQPRSAPALLAADAPRAPQFLPR